MRLDTMALTPITLDELNATAALLRRTDRKYPLGRADAQMVVATMPEGTRILTIDGRTRFDYESIYFDTSTRDSYQLAAKGRPHRFKVRIRHYQDTDEAFLEVKNRQGAATVKQRIAHDNGDLRHLHPDEYGFISEALSAGRIEGLDPRWLRPVLSTTYSRTTLLAPDGCSRITLDDDLRWRTNDLVQTADDLVIVETKTEGNASSIDRYLWSLGHRPGRISKYATGLAALRPELPANRWHRTLSTWFDDDRA